MGEMMSFIPGMAINALKTGCFDKYAHRCGLTMYNSFQYSNQMLKVDEVGLYPE